MARNLKVLFGTLILVIGILATSTGFFFAKTVSLQKNTNKSSSDSQDTNKNVATSATTATTPAAASAVTKPAPIGNRPSSPTDTVVVEAGETLYTIGLKVSLSWTVLADANGINADKIQAGQTLIIPKNNQISYTVNQEKASSIQKDVDAGKNTFRLSPVETAKSDSPSAYGIATEDTFTQVKVDKNAGTATVSVTHNGKNYEISLTEPVTKGEKGIWAIIAIKPV